MNGKTTIESERGTAALERSANWQLAGIGDMDGDGKDDILLRHTSGDWKGYLMDGRAVLDSRAVAASPAVSRGASRVSATWTATGRPMSFCATRTDAGCEPRSTV